MAMVCAVCACLCVPLCVSVVSGLCIATLCHWPSSKLLTMHAYIYRRASEHWTLSLIALWHHLCIFNGLICLSIGPIFSKQRFFVSHALLPAGASVEAQELKASGAVPSLWGIVDRLSIRQMENFAVLYCLVNWIAVDGVSIHGVFAGGIVCVLHVLLLKEVLFIFPMQSWWSFCTL